VTESRIGGLEIVPRRVVDYRGNRLEEMDIDAVLRRRPQVALVDELAHTNVPGSGRHTKRWQDVLELLDAEIDVVATVNIQHLESIADIAEAITGVRISERVPDWVVRQADQIELVDSSPEQLRTMALNERERPLAARALAGLEPKSMMANDLSARLARKASAALTDTDRELVDLSGPERKLIRRALRHGLGLDPGNPNLIAAWNPAAHPRAPAGGATGGQFAPGGTGPAPTNAAPVQQGQSGAQVRQLQERLNALGAHLAVDGKFGPATLAAVRAVQRGHKDAQGRQLKVDGLVGPLTTSARRLKPAPARKTAAPKTTPKKTTTVKPPPGASGKNVPVTYAHAAGRPGDDVLAFRFRHGWIMIGGPDGKGGKRERSPLIPEGLAPLEPQRVAERRMRKQAERWQRQSAPAKPVPPLRHPLIPEGLAPLEPGGKDRHGWVKLLEDKHAAEHAAGKTDHPRLHRAMARIKRRR